MQYAINTTLLQVPRKKQTKHQTLTRSKQNNKDNTNNKQQHPTKATNKTTKSTLQINNQSATLLTTKQQATKPKPVTTQTKQITITNNSNIKNNTQI